MNDIVVIGHLGADPKENVTTSGKRVVSIRVADNRGEGKNPIWWSISLWEEAAEKAMANKRLVKGALIYTRGSADADEEGCPRIWADKEGNARTNYEITAKFIMVLNSPATEEEREEPRQQEQQRPRLRVRSS